MRVTKSMCGAGCAFLVALVADLPAGSTLAQKAADRVVEVAAERFSFTPSEITMRRGQTVEIRITSDDTNHGFRIVGTDINVIVPKRGRGEAVVRFTPDEPGRYVFECSKLCGAGHNFMRGTIVVEDAER